MNRDCDILSDDAICTQNEEYTQTACSEDVDQKTHACSDTLCLQTAGKHVW